MQDDAIDMSEIAEVTDADLHNAEYGTLVNKIAVSIRLDQEILDWFKSKGPGYQTRINEVLADYIKDVAPGRLSGSRRGIQSVSEESGGYSASTPALLESFEYVCGYGRLLDRLAETYLRSGHADKAEAIVKLALQLYSNMICVDKDQQKNFIADLNSQIRSL